MKKSVVETGVESDVMKGEESSPDPRLCNVHHPAEAKNVVSVMNYLDVAE